MAEDQAGVEGVSALQTVAERVSAGDRVTEADARVLFESRDLIAVGSLADDVRRRLHGVRTTFVRVFEVHVDAPPGSLPSSVAAGEIRLVGTLSTLDHAIAVVTAARTLARGVFLTGFSLRDLSHWGVPVEQAAARLRQAGLEALAEVPVDAVADPSTVTAVRSAGLDAYRLTVHTPADISPAAMIKRAVDLQNDAGGFQAFAPLPRTLSPVTPTTGYDDVKLVAVARLMAPEIPSIQVDWPLYGPKLAQVALTRGADDVDGIAASDPGTLGVRRSALAEITGNIRAAALEPVERNGRFEPI